MKSSNFRRLLVCSLLIVTMVPVLLSTLPNFRASAVCGGGPKGSIGTFAIGIASCGGGHHGAGGGIGYHTGSGSNNNNSSNSTTTSMSSP